MRHIKGYIGIHGDVEATPTCSATAVRIVAVPDGFVVARVAHIACLKVQ